MTCTATRLTLNCSRVTCSLIFAAALFLSAAPARAELLNMVQLDFQNGTDSGSYQVAVPSFTDQFQYNLPSPVGVYSSGTGALLGTIKELQITMDGDPGITLGFNVDATNVATHVTFSSAVLAFAPLTSVQAFASAAITVTDNDSNGATASGLLPGGTAYQAQYNGGPIFTNLILTPVTSPVDGSTTASDRTPLTGTTGIPGIVSSIHSQFDFMLSPNDSASGTSRFNVTGTVVTPEPSTLVLALTGALGLMWRLRRRRVA